MRSNKTAAALLMSMLLTGCLRESDLNVSQPSRRWVEHTVAVVAPLGDAAVKTRLERTAQWFLDNFREAQLSDTLAVSLKIDWYDELSADMADLSGRLAADTTVTAVIGPFSNDNVAVFAAACKPTLKPLIAPTATSEEVIRRFAVSHAGSAEQFNKKPFLWALTETDVAFTDVLMSSYATELQYYGSDLGQGGKAAVLSPAGYYGQTFNYWAPFFAENDGITLLRNDQYSGTADLTGRMKSYLDEIDRTPGAATSAIFCVVETPQQLYDVARFRREWMVNHDAFKPVMSSPDPDDPANDAQWELFANSYRTFFAFNDICDEALEGLGGRGAAMLQGYQGFSPYADPTTGFETSYAVKFGQSPTFSECKFYDALMLAGFAAFYADHNDLSAYMSANEGIITAILFLTSVFNENQTLTAWAPTAMGQYLKAVEERHGEQYSFRGASGDIRFDAETFTTATSTTYLHWQILDRKVIHRSYFGDVGSGNVGNANAAWKTIYDEKAALADLGRMASGDAPAIQYPAQSGSYAVLVQSSNGMTNYRHQSDVLGVYQLLRRGGFDDDHIILILDRALATDKYNPEKGVIRSSPYGPDLLGGTDAGQGYPAAAVDYDAAGLSPSDISHILLGVKTARTPVVLPADPGQNVLLYWSGHGRSRASGGADELVWRSNAAGQGFTSGLMRETVGSMQAGGLYRKLFIVCEPCYSENVLRSVEGIPGVLAISGASGSEQSWAENWNPSLGRWGTWMSDRFTRNFVNCLSADPMTSYRDLYLYCTRNTIGSHVKIVNAARFGNLYATGPAEFIITQNHPNT